MKKIVLFLACALIALNASATSAFTVTRTPGTGDRLITTLPEYTTIGDYEVTYDGPDTAWGFTAVHMPISMTDANGNLFTDYAYLPYQNVLIEYNSISGPATITGQVYMQPVGPTTKEIYCQFAPIAPIDHKAHITVYSTFDQGLDQLISYATTDCTVDGFTLNGDDHNTSSPATFTYIHIACTVAPSDVPDRYTLTPAFSTIVGTFDITANASEWIFSMMVSTAGQFDNQLPQLKFARIVDALDGTPYGQDYTVSQSVNISTSLHLDSGEHRRVYVLSDVTGGMTGDFIRTNLHVCGSIDSFKTVTQPTSFCTQETLLAETVYYGEQPTAVRSVEKPIAEIYPNPSTEKIVVNAAVSEWTLTLADMTGRILRTTAEHAPTTTVERGELPAGIYFLKIGYPDGTAVDQKITFE